MVFWIGILVGALFARFAVKRGFYAVVIALFNIAVSVYLALFLGPVILVVVPGAGDMPYANILAIVTTGIGAFLVLHSISSTFLIGQFGISFHRILETLGAAVLGFAAGFLVWSFLTLLVSITPLSKHQIAKAVGLGRESRQPVLSNVRWWCDLVHKAAASEYDADTARKVIENLLEKAEKKMQQQPEPNEPPKTSPSSSIEN